MMTADLILANLSATSKKQAFCAIADETVRLFNGNASSLVAALIDRERIGTTGIGCGVAIPHIKLSGVDRTYGILVRLNEPVDFDAIDNAPVDIIFMLLAPSDSKTTQHLKMLAQMSRFLRDNATCNAIRATRDEAEIAALLNNWLRQQAA